MSTYTLGGSIAIVILSVFKLRTPNQYPMFCYVAKSFQIVKNNEKLKIWYDFAIFDMSLLQRKIVASCSWFGILILNTL